MVPEGPISSAGAAALVPPVSEHCGQRCGGPLLILPAKVVLAVEAVVVERASAGNTIPQEGHIKDILGYEAWLAPIASVARH